MCISSDPLTKRSFQSITSTFSYKKGNESVYTFHCLLNLSSILLTWLQYTVFLANCQYLFEFKLFHQKLCVFLLDFLFIPLYNCFIKFIECKSLRGNAIITIASFLLSMTFLFLRTFNQWRLHMQTYILALDQGTTNSKCIIFNQNTDIVSSAHKEIALSFPLPGWVEQDANEIWNAALSVIIEALSKSQISPRQIAGIGIANQRESTVIWNKHTGSPIYPAIIWQSRQTNEICVKLKEQQLSHLILEKTGLPIDPYFSATKIKWILEHVPNAYDMAQRGDLLFGTIDTWLVWKLTKGSTHVTDYSNASRTMLFNIKTLQWDNELLDLFHIPASLLPNVQDSSTVYGYTNLTEFGNNQIPITGIIGDQQAALFGQTCFLPGMIKNTYGTGGFLLMNTGTTPITSHNGLITTIAWGLNGKIEYALEGSIFVSGSAIQWLRDQLNIIQTADQSEALAYSCSDTGGTYLVPAFTGLGAPYWNAQARGAILGLTRGTNKAQLVRATLESLAYQSCDVISAMVEDSKIGLRSLQVDGGAAQNRFLLQFQSDLLNVPVTCPLMKETTALGAAFLAGLAVKYWPHQNALLEIRKNTETFFPEMNNDIRTELYEGWKRAVKVACSF